MYHKNQIHNPGLFGNHNYKFVIKNLARRRKFIAKWFLLNISKSNHHTILKVWCVPTNVTIAVILHYLWCSQLPKMDSCPPHRGAKSKSANRARRTTFRKVYPNQISSFWVPKSNPGVKFYGASCIDGIVTRARSRMLVKKGGGVTMYRNYITRSICMSSFLNKLISHSVWPKIAVASMWVEAWRRISVLLTRYFSDDNYY